MITQIYRPPPPPPAEAQVQAELDRMRDEQAISLERADQHLTDAGGVEWYVIYNCGHGFTQADFELPRDWRCPICDAQPNVVVTANA
jgi:rubrerythrin